MLTNAQQTSETEPYRGEVTRELEVMSKNLAALEALSGDLELKLGAVLAVRAVEVEAAKEPEAVRVPLAQDLYRCNVRLVERENHLRSILSHIEI